LHYSTLKTLNCPWNWNFHSLIYQLFWWCNMGNMQTGSHKYEELVFKKYMKNSISRNSKMQYLEYKLKQTKAIIYQVKLWAKPWHMDYKENCTRRHSKFCNIYKTWIMKPSSYVWLSNKFLQFNCDIMYLKELTFQHYY